MASIVRYDSKPVLKDPIFIEALPGIGDVGKVAGDFIAESFGAKRFASIYSEDFPPQVTVDDDCVAHMACNELWHSSVGGRDVIFLRGDFQGSTPEGQFYLAQDVMNILLDYNVSRIVTLGGFGTGCMVENPRVLGAVSKKELKAELEGYGVVFSPGEPEAGILGATGLLLGLGKIYGIDSVCLMGETSGFFVDHKGALAIVGVLMKILGTEYDTSDLKAKCVQIEELTAKVKEIDDRDSRDTLTYIR
ncbi:MAG: proteasome assembly chaperone family protein [Candidatus Methanomethylophilaceae archaeon]|nr:proteasome assembly chaperone family protein [Candidatus Methanomethylophilaceae archaeon]